MTKTIRLYLYIATVILCTAFPSLASAALDQKGVKKQLATQKEHIETIENLLIKEELNEERFLNVSETLRESRKALEDIADTINPEYENIQADIADLGPKPEGDNAPLEPSNIQQQRKQLNTELLATKGLLKQSDALLSKTSRLLEKVATLRREQFLNQLFSSRISPFNNQLWVGAMEGYTAQVSSYKDPLVTHLSRKSFIIPAGLFLFILLIIIRSSQKSLTSKLATNPDSSPFPFIANSLLLPFIVTPVGLFFVYQILVIQNIISDDNRVLCLKSLLLTAFLIFTYVVTKRLSKARIIRKSVYLLALATAWLYSADAVFFEAGKILNMSLELEVIQSYLVTSIFAVLLGLCSLIIVKTARTRTTYFLPRQTFVILLCISICIITANFFGYTALSRYIFERLVSLFALFAFALVIRSIMRPYLSYIDRLLSTKEQQDKNAKEPERLILFWLSLALDLTLLLVCLPAIAAMLGAEWSDIKEWVRQAFFGFKVGAMTISIANIVIAIIVFLVLLFISRIIQHTLAQKILPKTKIDKSIRESTTQVLGYIGLTIALMASISAIGFDLTNLALIAGALSVGIGFGLQSIVSNFVSGLILLFERPIKVGDWIITASGQGMVKKISVRATEIETFDRTSIIVPNAELISSSVKNWTHKDRTGRATVAVGVSYDSDPEVVDKILLQCLLDNKNILSRPEPLVHFTDFADSALMFEMKFFIRNITDIHKISKEVRFQVWHALKDAGVEISYPQRDLHIRTAPGLKGFVDTQ